MITQIQKAFFISILTSWNFQQEIILESYCCAPDLAWIRGRGSFWRKKMLALVFDLKSGRKIRWGWPLSRFHPWAEEWSLPQGTLLSRVLFFWCSASYLSIVRWLFWTSMLSAAWTFQEFRIAAGSECWAWARDEKAVKSWLNAWNKAPPNKSDIVQNILLNSATKLL